MPGKVLQLKATLLGVDPPIWRRLIVQESTRLERLHYILQVAFGWYDSHLHEFVIDGVHYAPDDGAGDPAWGRRSKSERAAKLGQVAPVGSMFIYIYDFGDSWEHEIVVEKIMAAEQGVTYPVCTGGKRAGPPEDCGGWPGYAQFLEAIGDPKHLRHEELLEWVGDSFDPEAFDPGGLWAGRSPAGR